MTLYHYTDQNGFMGIFLNQELWATKIQYLNDKKEYTLALELAKQYLEELIKNEEQQQNNKITKLNYYISIIPRIRDMHICVSSLTENGDLLSQWRGYSNKLSGYSIGFNKWELEPFIRQKGFELSKCIYETYEQKKRIKEMINQHIEEFNSEPEPHYKNIFYKSGEEFLTKLAKIAPLLKDSSFVEECEWRIIAPVNFENLEFRTSKSMLIPYYKINLDCRKNKDFDRLIDEIIVGHTPHPELAVNATKAFILKYFPPISGDYNECSIEVIQSKIPLINW